MKTVHGARKSQKAIMLSETLREHEVVIPLDTLIANKTQSAVGVDVQQATCNKQHARSAGARGKEKQPGGIGA
jgi:hypothetical protein